MYNRFAEVYDLLMDDFDYDAWARYYLRLIDRAGGKANSICDCACGTGSMAVRFALSGARVIGVDLSEDMLEQAAGKARRAGVMIPLIKQDICELQLHRPVGAIVCACDGVNYLTDGARARAFFARARALLAPGGVLAFDVSTPKKLLDVIGDNPFFEDRDGVTCLWKNACDRAAKTVGMDLTFFVRQGGGLYRRFDETHLQRAHELEELRAWLLEAGFTRVETYGDKTFEPAGSGDLRWHLTAV